MWVRMDDKVPHHPKLIRAGAEAAWFWQAGICYSNAHQLDGRLGKDILPALYAPLATKANKLARKLVEVGLWHDRGDHYEIHDYIDHQELALKESVEARREYERDRKRAQRQPGKAGQTPPDVPDNVPDNQGTKSDPVPRDTRARPLRVSAPPHPDPSRPEQTRPEEPLAPLGEVRVRDVDPSAAQIQTRFRKLYLARHGSEPYMGGKAVATFPERLIGTARAQGVDPLALLEQAFERWQPTDDIGKNAPYAAFAGRFGSLLETKHGDTGMSEQQQLQEQQIAAMKSGDRERYRSLVAEERRRFPSNGGADAKPAS
jgi:hypothetical protein